jgi:hypothetical protein
VCFAINRYFDLRVFFTLGNVLIYGWIINPIGLISFVIDILLYLTAGVLTVAFTGGV